MFMADAMEGLVEEAPALDERDALSKAIGLIGRTHGCVIITRGGKYAGIVDDRTLRRFEAPADPSVTKLGAIVEKAPVLTQASSVYDACGAFFTGDFKAIPVVHKEKPLGVVTRAGLLRSLLKAGVLGGRQVMNFMSSPVVSIEERSSVAQARAKMRKEHVGRLAVLRGAKLAGIITNYDIAALDTTKEKPPFVREKAGLSEQPVTSYMSSDVVTVLPEASLAEAAQQMLEHGISSLIVAKDEGPIGVLTTQDVFEALLEAEQRNVFITGLAEDEEEYKSTILNACGELLDRVEKSFPVEYVVVHVKRHEMNGKRKYSVRVRLKTPERIIAVKSFKWGLPQTVADALDELKQMMMQKLKRKAQHVDRMEQFEEGGRER